MSPTPDEIAAVAETLVDIYDCRPATNDDAEYVLSAVEPLIAARVAVEERERLEFGAWITKDEAARVFAAAGAMRDVVEKAVPAMYDDDGAVRAYLVTNGAIHRLVAVAQSAGLSVGLTDWSVVAPDSRNAKERFRAVEAEPLAAPDVGEGK